MSIVPLLSLGLGCTGPRGDSQAPAIADAIRFDSAGLPDCALSISDASFCAGWTNRNDRSDFPAGNWVPDYIWNSRDPAAVYVASIFAEEGQLLCASDADEADALLQEFFPQDREYVSGVDETDPRWLDVHFGDTGEAYKAFRVPRCEVFTSFANVASLWPAPGSPRSIDPIWQLAAPPADRVQFFDTARMIDVYRYVDTTLQYDLSALWAIGSASTDTEWTLRTCRLDSHSSGMSDGTYRTGIWQTDYVMDVASGRASLRADDVRGVICDHDIGSNSVW